MRSKILTFGALLLLLPITKSFASCQLIRGDLNELSRTDPKSLNSIALKYSTKVLEKEEPGYISFGISQSRNESSGSLTLARKASRTTALGNMVTITKVNVLQEAQVIESCEIKSKTGIIYSVTGIFSPLGL